jgi:hypothetical protein
VFESLLSDHEIQVLKRMRVSGRDIINNAGLRPSRCMQVLLLIMLILPPGMQVCAQSRSVSGSVIDAATNTPIPFANIRIAGTSSGTTSDGSGRFTLSLGVGEKKFVVSCLGYAQALRTIVVSDTTRDINFALKESAIRMQPVLVSPNDPRAVAIIRKAIDRKKLYEEILKNYRVSTHAKFSMKIDDIVGLSAESKAEIMAGPEVQEIQSVAYWAVPDGNKEVVGALKGTRATKTGMTINSIGLRTNFSRDVVQVGKMSRMTGPISEKGLQSYYYSYLGIMDVDSVIHVHKIGLTPRNTLTPLVSGTVYITDSSYLLAKVDVRFNDAALPEFFEDLAFIQNFALVENEYWLPSDAIVRARTKLPFVFTGHMSMNYMGIMHDYVINKQENEDEIDGIKVKVLPEARNVDPSIWSGGKFMLNTPEEVNAYKRSDSITIVETVRAKMYDVTSPITGKKLVFGESIYDTPGIFTVYRFNRVEGHSIHVPFEISNPFPFMKEFDVESGYGWSDKKWKYDLAASIWLFRRTGLHAGAGLFDRLYSIDHEQQIPGIELTTALNIFMKVDPRDYYYKKGYRSWIDGYVTQILHANVNLNREYNSTASLNTSWSLAAKDEVFRINPSINDGTITSIRFGMDLDFRNRMEDNGIIMRSPRANEFTPAVSVEHNAMELPGNSFSSTIFRASLQGGIGLASFGTLAFHISAAYSDNILPTQAVSNLIGSDNYLGAAWHFRTLRYREFGGDKTVAVFLEHSFERFPSLLFSIPNVPVLKTNLWELKLLYDVGWSAMLPGTKALLTVDTREANNVFHELGFGINNICSMFRIDCTWRLNHFRDGRNFYVTISASDVLRNSFNSRKDRQ